LGERKMIQIIQGQLDLMPKMPIPFGDDVSGCDIGDGKIAVLKTDMLVGSTDIPPGMTMKQAARKAVVANVSDLAAKGVRPLAGLVALGLPADLTAQDVREIASGLAQGAREYGFPLVGGDTNESIDLTISIALFATADQRQLVLRSGARPGDLVAVTGDFGNTAAGLKALLERKTQPKQLSRPLSKAVYNPRAQLELGVKLAASGAITASIDSSDGLACSLHEISKSSQVGILLNTTPVSRAAKKFCEQYHYSTRDLALYGGEEYHLVVTLRPSELDAASRAARGQLKQIGIVTREFRGVRLREAGREIIVKRKGWEHFKRQT
jgi:thiamine-monophosphate kinase